MKSLLGDEDERGIIRVVGSRVVLDSIVALFDRGATAEEIAQSFPSLSLGDVYAVLRYIVVRRGDVDAYMARRAGDEVAVREEVERRSPSAGLRERLLARRGKTVASRPSTCGPCKPLAWPGPPMPRSSSGHRARGAYS